MRATDIIEIWCELVQFEQVMVTPYQNFFARKASHSTQSPYRHCNVAKMIHFVVLPNHVIPVVAHVIVAIICVCSPRTNRIASGILELGVCVIMSNDCPKGLTKMSVTDNPYLTHFVLPPFFSICSLDDIHLSSLDIRFVPSIPC